ncbi:hypothetical protein EWB00_005302 [Schistosoma japonicum]|uniref:Uncharacterized protein n=1 Tax=Schistosoma japonicum TaxID=6182 RepID=A0A4Z2D1Z4_SCHJA|nr:hypothetical protein EWB00_005302 [Schistosoma japonicum]
MSDDFNIDHHQIELNVADLLIDNVMHSSLSSSSSSSSSLSTTSSYTVSSAEILALTLTFLYYVIMICLGVLCWLNARRKYKQRQKHTSTLIWSRFEISPNQLHIKYTDDDGDSMAT